MAKMADCEGGGNRIVTWGKGQLGAPFEGGWDYATNLRTLGCCSEWAFGHAVLASTHADETTQSVKTPRRVQESIQRSKTRPSQSERKQQAGLGDAGIRFYVGK